MSAVRWLGNAPEQACYRVGYRSRANPWADPVYLIGGQVYWKATTYANAWGYFDTNNDYFIERDYVQTDCGMMGQERPMPEASTSSSSSGSDSSGIFIIGAVVVAAVVAVALSGKGG